MTRKKAIAAVVAALALAGAATGAFAQYKVVDPQGHVTYTDTPPPATAAARATRLRDTIDTSDETAGPPLPQALRVVVGRYPVVLYTSADCAGCDGGRAQLQRRGVPFDERLVATPDDVAALQRLIGNADLPVLRIGEQTLRGYAPDAWDTYLSAAGYPALSLLPADYRPAPPQPLARRTVRAAAAASAPDEAAAATPSDPPPPRAPGGISF